MISFILQSRVIFSRNLQLVPDNEICKEMHNKMQLNGTIKAPRRKDNLLEKPIGARSPVVVLDANPIDGTNSFLQRHVKCVHIATLEPVTSDLFLQQHPGGHPAVHSVQSDVDVCVGACSTLLSCFCCYCVRHRVAWGCCAHYGSVQCYLDKGDT